MKRGGCCFAANVVTTHVMHAGVPVVEESWASSIVENAPVPDGIMLELKGNILSTTVNLVVAKKCIDLSDIDVERFSSLKRLIAVTAFVLKFKNKLLSRVRKVDHVVCGGELTVAELLGAESLWVKYEQTKLKKNSKFDQWRKSLGLFEDKVGMLRCRGRLGKSEWQYASKFPLLLISDSYFTKLLIRDCHEKVKHMGVESTLNKLRCRYWVIRGRQFTKVLASCLLCRKDQGKTLLPPCSPDLPSFRVAAEYSFQYTGVDFAGPLYVKEIYVTSSDLSKAYICLFTCATSRAIHLELTPSLESPAFIRALIRFMSRRGFPNVLISDNAKKVTKITRPLQKIIPLEVRNDVSKICDVDVPQVVDSSIDNTDDEATRRQPKRAAARTGELIRHLNEH